MEKEFVPYEVALKLKELGFDEPSPTFYTAKGLLYRSVDFNGYTIDKIYSNECLAPTFSQAFRWFREKYGLYHSIGLDNSLENDVNCDYQIINHSQSISEHETNFNNYEEAELACLEKLLEIVNPKSKKDDVRRRN